MRDRIDPLSTDFEIMYFVMEQRMKKGACSVDEAVRKFGRDGVRALIAEGMLSETSFGMVSLTRAGAAVIRPDAVRLHIQSQIAREKNQGGSG